MALSSARGSQGPPARTPSASPGRNSQGPPPALPFGPRPTSSRSDASAAVSASGGCCDPAEPWNEAADAGGIAQVWGAVNGAEVRLLDASYLQFFCGEEHDNRGDADPVGDDQGGAGDVGEHGAVDGVADPLERPRGHERRALGRIDANSQALAH